MELLCINIQFLTYDILYKNYFLIHNNTVYFIILYSKLDKHNILLLFYKFTPMFYGLVIIGGILYNIYIKKPGYIFLQPGMFYEREADYYGWTVDERF